ncbi:hypothetical protein JHW43_007022 [Diplocarpon mali]|nr:hypothetical protein JHW43_007022 [Diplocarpon mali]
MRITRSRSDTWTASGRLWSRSGWRARFARLETTASAARVGEDHLLHGDLGEDDMASGRQRDIRREGRLQSGAESADETTAAIGRPEVGGRRSEVAESRGETHRLPDRWAAHKWGAGPASPTRGTLQLRPAADGASGTRPSSQSASRLSDWRLRRSAAASAPRAKGALERMDGRPGLVEGNENSIKDIVSAGKARELHSPVRSRHSSLLYASPGQYFAGQIWALAKGEIRKNPHTNRWRRVWGVRQHRRKKASRFMRKYEVDLYAEDDSSLQIPASATSGVGNDHVLPTGSSRLETSRRHGASSPDRLNLASSTCRRPRFDTHQDIPYKKTKHEQKHHIES